LERPCFFYSTAKRYGYSRQSSFSCSQPSSLRSGAWCGVAQNIPQLIAGRTVFGVGAAVICACFCLSSSPAADRSADIGTTQIVTDYSPPGPRTALWPSLRFHLIGGGLTDHVNWVCFNSLSKQTRSDTRLKRWCFNRFNLFACLTKHLRCFYLNLPLGGVSVCGVGFLLKTSPPLGSDSTHSLRDSGLFALILSAQLSSPALLRA
jgi:MFS family permease